ncbi:MAG: hypothetical protein IJZ07_08425 [Clostridia bacterium]|nr:hypothetical protein [Clostridia bacterium]
MIAPIFKCAENIKDFPVGEISNFPWEKDGASHPESYAAIFAVEGDGIHAVLWSFEEDVLCSCTKRDDPVYTDSCLELFLMPIEGDNRYINFEVNKNGVYLSQIGTCRGDRVFIKSLTCLEPIIKTMEITENGKTAWGCEITLPERLISELYGTDFNIGESTVKGNFYKCAELSKNPHFGTFFPVNTQKPDFHRPEFFGEIKFRKA